MLHRLFEMAGVPLREVMTRDEAMRILRVTDEVDPTELKAIWKRRMQSVHPDAGGNDREAALVNAAYDLLKVPQAAPYGGGRDWTDPPKPPPSKTPPWAMAGYAGGMYPSSDIRANDYTDVNYFKKQMWELSGESNHPYTIWAFDGNYFRGVITVFGSPDLFATMARAMYKYNSQGFNRYATQAIFVDDDADRDSRVILLIWSDGVSYADNPIEFTYEAFNRNPGNDPSFMRRLPTMLAKLKETGSL